MKLFIVLSALIACCSAGIIRSSGWGSSPWVSSGGGGWSSSPWISSGSSGWSSNPWGSSGGWNSGWSSSQPKVIKVIRIGGGGGWGNGGSGWSNGGGGWSSGWSGNSGWSSGNQGWSW